MCTIEAAGCLLASPSPTRQQLRAASGIPLATRNSVSGLGYLVRRDLRMVPAGTPTPPPAPTAGRAVFIVSLLAAEPTLPAADEALDVTLSTTPVDAGFGGAGARFAPDGQPGGAPARAG